MVKKKIKSRTKKKPIVKKYSFDYFKERIKEPKHFFFYLFVLVVLGLVINFSVNKVQASLEKRDLLDKQSQLKEIANRIAAENPPSEQKSYEYCRYASRKYGEGPLNCSAGIEFKYNPLENTQTKPLINNVNEYIDNRFNEEDIETFINTQYRTLGGGLLSVGDTCSLSIVDETGYVRLLLSCSKTQATGEYFPAQN